MTFPRKSLLPLIQKALLAYKEFLNPSGYSKYGCKLMEVTTHNVAINQELQRQWVEAIQELVDKPIESDVLCNVVKTLTFKMLHSQCNEFLVTMRTLEIINTGKKTDIDVALRLKLKTHASEKFTK